MLTSNLLFSWVSNRLKQKFYSSPQIAANQKVADVDVDNILMDKYKTRHITTWYATRIEWIAYPQKRSLNAIYWAFCLSLYLSISLAIFCNTSYGIFENASFSKIYFLHALKKLSRQ